MARNEYLAEHEFVKEEAASPPPTPRTSPPPEVVAMAMDPTGSICGRIRANPLKHLARLLHKKLEAAQGAPCNLLQVATEIHSQAKDKHNTTFRRIYDVVNVCEGAGVLARSVQRASQSETPHVSHKERAKRSLGLDLGAPQTSILPHFQLTAKRSPRGGAEIRWLGRPCVQAHGEDGGVPHNRLLERERTQAVDRVLQKKKLLDAIGKQVTVLKTLLDQNQARARRSRAVAVPGSDGDGFLPNPFVPCSSSARARGQPGPAATDAGAMLRSITPESSACVHRTAGSLERLGGPDVEGEWDARGGDQSPQPRAARRLHVPFIMLATDPDTNVEIFMDGDPPREVHLQLDRDYQLVDHIQMVQMLRKAAH